jgi:hypothetical protein
MPPFRQHHAKAQMTRSQNRLAFTMWKSGCTDAALASANAVSLANSYGLDPTVVAQEIQREITSRRVAAAMKGDVK